MAPCIALAADAYVTAPVADPRLQVFILSGVRQPTPPDVMRGEETQIPVICRETVTCLVQSVCPARTPSGFGSATDGLRNSGPI